MGEFLSVTSPVFSKFVIIIEGDEISDLPSDVTFFETLRATKEARPPNLVFSLGALSPVQEEARRRLAGALVWKVYPISSISHPQPSVT